jgi:predicted HAD superfamily Cof-like phosphohydrolase
VTGPESGIAAQVRAFYVATGKPIREVATTDLAEAEVAQVRRLLTEEVGELLAAFEERNILKIADGLGDVAYVIYGAALQFGIDLERVLDVVHASNMSKLNADGTGRVAEDGKVMRGDAYEPPDIAGALEPPS